MLHAKHRLTGIVALLALVPCAVHAGEAPKEGAKDKAAKDKGAKKPPAKPSTHTVKRGPFKIEAQLKGVFEARNMTEVVFRPEAWPGLVVRQAVEQGTRVKAGDVVIALDTKKIDEAIRDMEDARSLSDVSFRLMREEVAELEKTVPLDLAAAERASRHADEDLKRYARVDRALSVKQTRQSLKSSEQWLANAEEELKQLEKMYEADDLTEETEEIILKRQRHAVERARLGLEVRRAATDKALNIDLPRRDVSTKETARRQALALEKARATMPMSLSKKRLEIEKAERARKKAAQKLAKTKRDREAMTVRSPVDGVVYYGRCVRGNWPGLATSLLRGTTLKAHSAALTVVQPRPMFVRAPVPEKELGRVREGLEGKATPSAFPDARLGARVETVTTAPVAAGKFEARISFEDAEGAARLVPGMSCTVKLVSYVKKDALTVPASAVFSDELDEDRKFVYLRKKDGGHEKRFVAVGKKTDKKAEIVEGLGEGDVVLLEKPKESK